MSNPFVAEIRIFPFNFAPTGWAFCNGQILPLSQKHGVVFTVGHYLRRRREIQFCPAEHAGQCAHASRAGSGAFAARPGRDWWIGHRYPSRRSEIPSHSHSLMVEPLARDAALSESPHRLRQVRGRLAAYSQTTTTGLVQMSDNTVAPAGGDQPHNNLQPYLTLEFFASHCKAYSRRELKAAQ